MKYLIFILKETEQKLKLQFESAKSDYEFSLDQYTTAKNNLSLAERIENKQQIKFREGLSSSFDFAEAQKQLYTNVIYSSKFIGSTRTEI